MALALPRRHSRAVVPSIGAGVVVVGVVAANCWTLATAQPEKAPLDPMQRLGALQSTGVRPGQGSVPSDAGHLPANAQASTHRVDGFGAAGAWDRAGLPRGDEGRGGEQPRSDAMLAGGLPAGVVVAPTARRTVGLGPSLPVAAGALSRSWVVQPGEGLGAALGRLYVTPTVARAVVDAYATVRSPTKLQAGWRLWGRFDSVGVMDSGGLATLVVAPVHGEGVTVERTAAGAFTAREGGLPGTLVRVALRCGVIGSLESSLRRCGEGEGLAATVGAVLGDRLAEEVEPRTGDELRLVVDKLMDGEQLLRYHRLVALQWRAAVGGQRVTGFWFTPTVATRTPAPTPPRAPAGGAYYAADGQSLESLFLRQPLRSGHTTSTFGMRLHPILHKFKAHYGVDFGAPRGTPVYAAADGVLTAVGRAGAAGNLVRLRHDGGWATEYMHLQKFAPGARVGDRVGKGETIGFVGTTGRSTGPHLHFGVKRGGRYVDPQAVGDELRAPVPAGDRREFDQHTRGMRDMIDALEGSGGSGT